jgi:hypothetical protein
MYGRAYNDYGVGIEEESKATRGPLLVMCISKVDWHLVLMTSAIFLLNLCNEHSATRDMSLKRFLALQGKQTSVFTGELAAIRMAMDQIENESLQCTVKVLDLNRQYELDKGNRITKNLATYTHPFVYECKQKCWQLREMKGLILRRDRLLWAIWCTMHNRLLKICFQSQNREFWTNGRRVGKSLKQEGFQTPFFPGSLLDHGLRNERQRENL